MIHITVVILHITQASDLALVLAALGMAAVMADLAGAVASVGAVMADFMIHSSLHGVMVDSVVNMAAFGADMAVTTEDGAVMDTVAFGAADTIATV